MKRFLISAITVLLVCQIASARNPRTFNVYGTWDGDEGATFKAGDAEVTVNFEAGSAADAAEKIVTTLTAAGNGWSASRVGTKVTVSNSNIPKKQIKIEKVNIKNSSSLRCSYSGHRFEGDEFLELEGSSEGGSVSIIFPGSLGTVTADTSAGMTLDEAMMQLELELNDLISNMDVSFGVDIEDTGQVFMPLLDFDLIGEDVSYLGFSSTDPGLVLGYAPCPSIYIPTVSEWGMVLLVLLLLTGIGIKFGRRALKTG